ncbi:MAG: hypothetical protein MSIBF_01085 [Candidatus Altiarchaeales archaeon IMC4]|nr:MAG: hypothetical protein MSIBF_01085 [Candidatus Altiarchaeales archaeon IMC4]
MESKLLRLRELLTKLNDGHAEIDACMIAKKNLEGVLIIPETFKRDIAPIWEILEQALNDELDVVAKYSR